ncbi:hypothetical protein D3C76_1805930 [compost metagenome]
MRGGHREAALGVLVVLELVEIEARAIQQIAVHGRVAVFIGGDLGQDALQGQLGQGVIQFENGWFGFFRCRVGVSRQ